MRFLAFVRCAGRNRRPQEALDVTIKAQVQAVNPSDETLARELEQIARELLLDGDERWYPLSVAAERIRRLSIDLDILRPPIDDPVPTTARHWGPNAAA